MKALNRKSSTIIAILLAMGLLLVTACNRNGVDEDDNGGAVIPADTTSDPAPPVQQVDPAYEPTALGGIHQPRDLGGATITAAMWWEGGIAYGMPERYYEEPDPATSANYHRERLIWDNARRVEREFNVQFDDVVFSGAGYVIPTLTFSICLNIQNH